MINNAAQYAITKQWLKRFEEDLAALEVSPPRSDIDPAIRQAQLDAARSEIAELRAQILEYVRSRVIVQYVIYDHPTDLPNYFVLRKSFIKADEDMELPAELAPQGTFKTNHPCIEMDVAALAATNLAALHAKLPPGLILFPLKDPDPKIIEVWI